MNKIKLTLGNNVVVEVETTANCVEVQNIVVQFKQQPTEVISTPDKVYKITFSSNVNVKTGHSSKIANIKAVRTITGYGLGDSKQLVESTAPVLYVTQSQIDLIKNIPGVNYTIS